MTDDQQGEGSIQREPRRVLEGPAANARLRDLDLEPDDLIHAVFASEMDRRSSSPLEPPGAAGSRAYFGGCRGLAERLLVREDWQRTVDRNVPRIVNTQTRMAVIFSSGDFAVGLVGRTPRSKNEKGSVAADVVRVNEQLIFPEMDVPRFRPIPAVEHQKTWVLLVYADDVGALRAELSLPLGLDDYDHYSDWTERIILDLPRFDGGLRHDERGDEVPEVEITVRSRG